MSGREHEPVAAFFPSIDRNLILDLDRHLRGAKAVSENAALPAPSPTPTPARSLVRPDIAGAVEAVEQAAHSLAAMTGRIGDLEHHIDVVEAANRQLEAQLTEARQAIQDAETALRDETDRALRNENAAAQQSARASDLERELSAAHADLSRVTDAIASALVVHEENA